MDIESKLSLGTPRPIETGIVPETIKAVEKAALDYIAKETKGHPLAPEVIELFFTGSKQEWEYNWKKGIIAAVEGAYKISNKDFRNVHIASIEAEIKLHFNEIQDNGHMSISCKCHGGMGKNVVTNPTKTRTNSADGSVDFYFNNFEDLHLMGLKFKYDEKVGKYAIITILWQFHGKARQDSQETMRLSITGGEKDCVFCRNEGKTYSILGSQDHFTLRYTGMSNKDIKDTDIIHIGCSIRNDATEYGEDWLEGKYDYTHNQWRYRICKDAIMDGDINFASETWYPLENPQLFTIDGISIRMESVGRLFRRKRFFSLFR